LVEAVEQIKAGNMRPGPPLNANQNPLQALTLNDLGLVMVPNVLERTPPFVDTVRPGSAAAKAGLRPDDLIVYVESQLVQSCNTLTAELGNLDRDSDVHLLLLRSGQLTEITLKADDLGHK
jgi:S1-C subfamily serine protease